MRWALTQRLLSDSRLAIIGPMSSGTPTRPSAVMSAKILLTAGLSRTAPPPKSVSIARCHRVDGDSASTQFLRHVDAEYFDCAFRCRIGGVAGKGHAGQSGGQVHDTAAVRDQWQQRLGEEVHALEVDIDQSVELRLGGLSDQRVVAVAGIVHEVVESLALPDLAQHASQTLGERCKALDVAAVELQGDCLAPHRVDLLDHVAGVVATALKSQNDIAASAGNVQSRVSAESTAGAGHDCNLGHGKTPWV